MEVIKYPSKTEWKAIVARPHLDTLSLHNTVTEVLQEIKERGG